MINKKPPSYSYNWFTYQFDKAEKSTNTLLENTDDECLLRRPAPDKWSAVECLDHLVEFGDIYYEIIQKGVSDTHKTESSHANTFPPRFVWKWVIRFFEPPYRMKMKTISSFKPKEKDADSIKRVSESFFELQERFKTIIHESEKKRLDLSSVKVRHPVLSFFKMTLSECLAIVDAHQRRHLWQAEQTVQKIRASDN